jgi:hypothetical protein
MISWLTETGVLKFMAILVGGALRLGSDPRRIRTRRIHPQVKIVFIGSTLIS